MPPQKRYANLAAGRRPPPGLARGRRARQERPGRRRGCAPRHTRRSGLRIGSRIRSPGMDGDRPDDDALRVENLDQVGDAHSHVGSGLFENLARERIALFGGLDDVRRRDVAPASRPPASEPACAARTSCSPAPAARWPGRKPAPPGSRACRSRRAGRSSRSSGARSRPPGRSCRDRAGHPGSVRRRCPSPSSERRRCALPCPRRTAIPPGRSRSHRSPRMTGRPSASSKICLTGTAFHPGRLGGA